MHVQCNTKTLRTEEMLLIPRIFLASDHRARGHLVVQFIYIENNTTLKFCTAHTLFASGIKRGGILLIPGITPHQVQLSRIYTKRHRAAKTVERTETLGKQKNVSMLQQQSSNDQDIRERTVPQIPSTPNLYFLASAINGVFHVTA